MRTFAALTITVVLITAAFAIIRYEQSAGGGYNGAVILIAALSTIGAVGAVIALVRSFARITEKPQVVGWIVCGLLSSIGLLIAGIAFGLRG